MKPLSILIYLTIATILCSCHKVEDWENNTDSNFELLWKTLDEHYCFFREKGIDWDSVKAIYQPQINAKLSARANFRVMAAMLNELRDGHVNLSAPFETSYYRKWWSDYPQNYNQRLIQEHYTGFNYSSLGGADFAILTSGIGYLHWGSFDFSLGTGNIDNILAYFVMCPGLIIDMRDNGGGSLDNVDDLIAHFITKPTVTGYICHKTGPGHDDFSERRPITVDPVSKGHIYWGKPVAVLTNRSTFSAANYFVAAMKSLPKVTIVGATTGGGCGMPYSSELANGWGVRFSACPIYDPEGVLTEFGVEPDTGCAIDITDADITAGKDPIIDCAITLLLAAGKN